MAKKQKLYYRYLDDEKICLVDPRLEILVIVIFSKFARFILKFIKYNRILFFHVRRIGKYCMKVTLFDVFLDVGSESPNKT